MKNFEDLNEDSSFKRQHTYINLIIATLNQVWMLEEMLHWKDIQFLLAVEFSSYWSQSEKDISITSKDLNIHEIHPLHACL